MDEIEHVFGGTGAVRMHPSQTEDWVQSLANWSSTSPRFAFVVLAKALEKKPSLLLKISERPSRVKGTRLAWFYDLLIPSQGPGLQNQPLSPSPF